MAFCKNCGTELSEDVKFCPKCGTAAEEGTTAHASDTSNGPSASAIGDTVDKAVNQAQEAFERFTDTADHTSQFDQMEIQNGKVMGILAYIGILVLIPIFAEKNNRFVRYHANQGLVLFGAEVIYTIVIRILLKVFFTISWRLGLLLSSIFNLLWLVFLAYAILGIVNVCLGKAKELPLIGNIKILQ